MPLPVGLVYDAAGHVILDPDTAIQRRAAAPVRHLRGHRVGHRRGQGVPRRRAVLPLAAPQRTPQGRGRLEAAAPPHRAAGAAQPPLRRRVHLRPPPRPDTARRQDEPPPSCPASEWIAFIPGAHPGYITLDQYEANIAKLAANAAAHGRDRAAGPPREGPALLQGIIICGRCGSRMTVRYHTRGTRQVPTYACQRDGIENARPFCAVIPGAHPRPARRPAADRHAHPAGRRGRPPGLRRTPSTAPPKPTRCAPPTSSAPATTPTWPAAATWPSTPPTGSSPAPSKPTGTPRCAPSTTPRPPTTRPASSTPARSPPPRRTGSPSWSPTCPASGTTPPPRPANASASPGCCSPTSP